MSLDEVRCLCGRRKKELTSAYIVLLSRDPFLPSVSSYNFAASVSKLTP